MWPRVSEMALACWLALCPFIFGYLETSPITVANDWICATVIFVTASLAFVPLLRKIHLVIALVGVWLAGYAYFGYGYPSPPEAQNEFMIGLILMTFGIIPSYASLPPYTWAQQLVKTELAQSAKEQLPRESRPPVPSTSSR